MNQKSFFGTYDVPPISNESSSASFTAPGNMSKEDFENTVLCLSYIEESEKDNQVDKSLNEGLPKPKSAV